MLCSRVFIIVCSISISILQSGCANVTTSNASSGSGANSNARTNANSARNDVEELGLRVTMPFETEELVWKEFASEKKLVAIMRFTPENSATIVAEAEKVRPSTRVDLTTETWFPPELIAQADMTGDDRLSGSSYAANSFIAAPFSDGSLVRVDNTDYFILQVTAK